LSDFKQQLERSAGQVADILSRLIPEPEGFEARLGQAMRYATLNGGKRLRPFLVLMSARLFEVPEERALRVAAALEMVHSYSLVHDDLPAMDDDDVRRGQPTCHIRFDEATAILAGDALLTYAFEILGHPDTHADGNVRAALVVALARAAGWRGMVGGQMLDLMAEERTLDMEQITRLQRLKTGMLIAVACETGAILGHAPRAAHHALAAYAHDLGLAFQIADDLLDVEGDADVVGKKIGKDAVAGKETFVSLMGAGRARDQARMLVDQAIAHLEPFEERADTLRDLARYVIDRSS
jgi:farnesyl diphosphate synthase